MSNIVLKQPRIISDMRKQLERLVVTPQLRSALSHCLLCMADLQHCITVVYGPAKSSSSPASDFRFAIDTRLLPLSHLQHPRGFLL